MTSRRKEISTADPLALLREYIVNNKPIKAKDDYLNFGGTKISIYTKTAWQPAQTQKIYDLGSLWLYLDSVQNPSKYPENKYYDEIKRLNLQIINTFDREEIVNYFTGKKDYSEAINSEFNYTVVPLKGKEKEKKHKDKEKDRHREERKDDIEGAHPSKRVKTAEGGAGGDQMEEEKDHAAQKEREYIRIVDFALKLEKALDHKNKALRRLEKSFKFSLDFFATEKASTGKEGPEGQANKEQLCKLDQILRMPTPFGESRPIIIVLANNLQGGITLSNAKSFLEDGRYQDVNSTFSAFEKSKVTVRRNIRGKMVTFDVLDNISEIKQNNAWYCSPVRTADHLPYNKRNKIVALFVTGISHQFSDFPDGNKPSILFSRSNSNAPDFYTDSFYTQKKLVRGFFTKYKDMPLPENVKKWNVRVLEVYQH